MEQIFATILLQCTSIHLLELWKKLKGSIFDEISYQFINRQMNKNLTKDQVLDHNSFFK